MDLSLDRLIPRPRHFLASLAIAVLGVVLWYSTEQGYRDRMSWMGVTEWAEPSTLAFTRVLRNEGYLLGWSDLRVGALWASYELRQSADHRVGPRPGFKQDWRTLWPVSTTSYAGSGYDRGHLAPNYAMAKVWGEQAQHDSFLMSNMMPQKPALNRQLWQRLEEVVMDHFLPRFGRLQVVTGPVYAETRVSDLSLDRLLDRVSFVEVPIGFYKVVVVPGETPLAVAFVMPQNVRGDESLSRYLVSIDEVEAVTGLNFFPRLGPQEEAAWEARAGVGDWALSQVAELPSRFD
ncbi:MULTISPECIES: DNA/RNA non-specific endonuclease [Halomonas]|uniref:DNA/RNA non-specific endonuclease n=1 Tax=Halomonas TaxID=2745 RepID=UPI001CD71FA4|nr:MULTISPECIES: DNA/RNA non-specific endonuclease [Halomonas]MCA0916482.1 DNA/RNA non-specific endonuclease [Halomonas denitrificans]